MDRRLLQPRWLIAHAVVLAIGVLFVSLGFWQLSRLEERRLENEVGESRLSASVVPLSEALASVEDPITLEYRRVSATGTFDPANEVLIRSQTYLGTAGFHVITPLLGESGEDVLVNRGWIPLTMEEIPVSGAAPPLGQVTVSGWVQLSQERPMFGPEDPPEGRLTVMNRVDIERISKQVPMSLAPVYVVELGEQGSEVPVPLDLPQFSDEGPHLAYAIQWFGFTVVGIVGYYFLVRRRLKTSG